MSFRNKYAEAERIKFKRKHCIKKIENRNNNKKKSRTRICIVWQKVKVQGLARARIYKAFRDLFLEITIMNKNRHEEYLAFWAYKREKEGKI